LVRENERMSQYSHCAVRGCKGEGYVGFPKYPSPTKDLEQFIDFLSLSGNK
ncbi:hypothetical protein Trydic_g10002, partial [Trypoxylus dichotomus]